MDYTYGISLILSWLLKTQKERDEYVYESWKITYTDVTTGRPGEAQDANFFKSRSLLKAARRDTLPSLVNSRW